MRKDWKDTLGEVLYDFVKALSDSKEETEKITGMLINIENELEVINIISDYSYFLNKTS